MRIVYIDDERHFINQLSELAEKYSVMSVPTIVLFKDGEEIARKSGAEKKAVLEEWITQSLDK